MEALRSIVVPYWSLCESSGVLIDALGSILEPFGSSTKDKRVERSRKVKRSSTIKRSIKLKRSGKTESFYITRFKTFENNDTGKFGGPVAPIEIKNL